MGFVLAPTALIEGYRLETFETVGSTNVVALDRARASDQGRLWLVARRQESGRGRRGRVWETPNGNLAATLLLFTCCPLPQAATLGFVAGLALSDALAAVAPGARIAVAPDGGQGREGAGRYELKWPNDVLADGGKLAGILLESVLLSEKRFAVAVGIGVNVAAHPEGLPYPAISLAGLGIAARPRRSFSPCRMPGCGTSVSGTGAGAFRRSAPPGWRAPPVSVPRSRSKSAPTWCVVYSRRSTRSAAFSSATRRAGSGP